MEGSVGDAVDVMFLVDGSGTERISVKTGINYPPSSNKSSFVSIVLRTGHALGEVDSNEAHVLMTIASAGNNILKPLKLKETQKFENHP